MSEIKRQDLPKGTLAIVATPIGNLEDLSPRARWILEQADVVLCEDTRRTAQLITALGISGGMKRLERLDAHSSAQKIEILVERLKEGETFALVTDAGTPAVSDPGSAIVARAHEQGIAVMPIPGPSAILALLSASGFHESAFVFRGFFPRKNSEREQELELCKDAAVARVFVWFESPQRIVEALKSVSSTLLDAQVVAAKELTKIHETFFVGSAADVASQVSREIEKEGTLGEWCFALQLATEKHRTEDKSSDWVKALHCLIDARVSASEAARQVSQHFGAPRKTVYEMALRISGKKSE